jgi:REP element-mobilizing transposase RayT
MAQFKSIVTKRINTLRSIPSTPVWQRNYYEHIIRNESDLIRIRNYIAANPLRWAKDENKLQL